MEILRLAIAGLPAGGMYALAAIGIVLIYRATGTLNFAQGAVATGSAFIFNWAWVQRGMALGVAIAVAVGCASLFGLVLERLMRAIGPGNVLAQVIATLGVQGVVLWSCDRAFGAQAKVVPPYFPNGGIELGGVWISYDQLAVVGIAAALAAVLGLVLTRTSLGRAVRAVSQNRDAASLAGLNVPRLQALSWMCGSALAGLAGVLLAPLLFVDSIRLNLFFLVKPFAAAVVGGLFSLPVAFIAGITIGVTEGVLVRYTVLPGLTETAAFALMLLALLLRKQFRLERVQASLSRGPAVRAGAGRLWPGLLVAAGACFLIPGLSPADIVTFRLAACYALLALSLVILTGWVGQVSLAQGAFFGLGAFLAALFSNRADLPFPLVLVLAPLCVVPVAVILGVPALRFRGLLLAVVTLGFGALCSASLFQWRTFTGGLDGSHLGKASLFGYDLTVGQRFDFFLVAVVGLTFLGVRNLARFRAGGPLIGVRESEEGAAALGMGVTTTKLVAFGISGFVAGLGGCLFGYSLEFVSGEQFTPLLSATILTVVVVAGLESLWGAALAGVIYAVPSGPSVQMLSAAAVIVTLIVLPGGLTRLPARIRALLPERAQVLRTAAAPLRGAAR